MNLDFAKVCGKHSAIYEAYYKQIDPKGSGAIEAMTAAKFLKKSGLSDVVLSRIWDLSDPNGKGFLDKPGFFVALKLVSLAQTGLVVNMSNIYMDTANPPKVGDLPKIIPPRQVPAPGVGATNTDWSISVIDRLKYEQLFEAQKPVAGKLPGNKVRGLLLESKLPMDTLGKIWDLADQDKDGNLSKHEFIVAMHLVYQTLANRSLPEVLPLELRKGPVGAVPPPKPAPPQVAASMPRAPSGEGFGEGGFVAHFPKDIAPPPVIPPPLPVAVPPMTRVPPVGASSVPALISTDPLIPIGAPPSVTGNVDWIVTPSELKRYEVMFRDSDRDKDGLVSGLEVKNIFLQSGVPQHCLAHIWALCDTNQSGKLTVEQFALAMWMVERKQQGIEPPQVLTANMVPPSMRSIISGVDLQPQEPKPTYTNPELEMISKEIEELARERNSLETEIAQKEADIRIKSGEVRSLQSELDTLSATLKQLENQRGEAQKRLDDLKTQVNKIRDQCQKQEDTINEQEGELNAKRSELQKLKDEEAALQKEYDDNNNELQQLTHHLQKTQLQISSIRSMVTQLMEAQRQMTDALLMCRAAIESQDGELVSEYQLKIEPDLDEARQTLEKKIDEPQADPFTANSTNSVTQPALSNGFGTSDPFASVARTGFDDSFSAPSGFNSGFDDFGSNAASGFGQQAADPFGSDAFGHKPNAVTPQPGQDDFGSDPFAALHAPTGQGKVLSPNSQKSGPPPRPESPSPALPPKKSKVPPPRPAPPRPIQNPTRPTQPSADAFGSSGGSGGFADFADFDNKLPHIPPPLSMSTSSLAAKSIDYSFTPFVAVTTSTSTLLDNSSSLFADFDTITTSTKTDTETTATNDSKTMSSLLTATSINSTITNLNTTSTTTNVMRSITPQQQQAAKVPKVMGPTDFSDDPFKDYRYEDPFTLKDPFADDNEAEVFPDPEKVFKDDISSDEEETQRKQLKKVSEVKTSPTPGGSDFLENFAAFNLNPSSVPTTRSTSTTSAMMTTKTLNSTDGFADFDAFSNNNSMHNKNNGSTKSLSYPTNDAFFDAFNDNFSVNTKKVENTNIFDAFGSIDSNGNKNNIKNDAFSVDTVQKSTKTFSSGFNDNGFDDDFFASPTNSTSVYANNNSNKLNNKPEINDNFAKFADFDSSSSFADFNTALNNSLNMTLNSGAEGATSSPIDALNKVHNKTALTKLDNLNAAKMPEKFSADYSQADSYEADLQEALKRSMIEH